MIYRTLRDCLVQFISYAGTIPELGQGDVPKLGFEAGILIEGVKRRLSDSSDCLCPGNSYLGHSDAVSLFLQGI